MDTPNVRVDAFAEEPFRGDPVAVALERVDARGGAVSVRRESELNLE